MKIREQNAFVMRRSAGLGTGVVRREGRGTTCRRAAVLPVPPAAMIWTNLVAGSAHFRPSKARCGSRRATPAAPPFRVLFLAQKKKKRQDLTGHGRARRGKGPGPLAQTRARTTGSRDLLASQRVCQPPQSFRYALAALLETRARLANAMVGPAPISTTRRRCLTACERGCTRPSASDGRRRFPGR